VHLGISQVLHGLESESPDQASERAGMCWRVEKMKDACQARVGAYRSTSGHGYQAEPITSRTRSTKKALADRSHAIAERLVHATVGGREITATLEGMKDRCHVVGTRQ